jgi:hypothetical protein
LHRVYRWLIYAIVAGRFWLDLVSASVAVAWSWLITWSAFQGKVRPAAVADSAALTRLREAMLSDMGMRAAGVCDRHAPGPGNPGGGQGLIFNMSNRPRVPPRLRTGLPGRAAGLVPR